MESLCCTGSSGSVRALSLSALRHTHLLGSDTSKHAFHSLLLDSGHPREGPWPLLQPTHTPGTRLPGGFLSSSLPSSNHRVINQATSCLAFPLPSLPLFWCFPEAPKEAVASQRAVSQDSAIFSGPWAKLPEDISTHTGLTGAYAQATKRISLTAFPGN